MAYLIFFQYEVPAKKVPVELSLVGLFEMVSFPVFHGAAAGFILLPCSPKGHQFSSRAWQIDGLYFRMCRSSRAGAPGQMRGKTAVFSASRNGDRGNQQQ